MVVLPKIKEFNFCEVRGKLAAAGGSWQEHLTVCDHPPEGRNGTRMRRMGRIDADFFEGDFNCKVGRDGY